VRVKLDENLPSAALTAAALLGHDADSVGSENLTGATDDEVLAAATRNDRLLLTLDRRFADVRAHPPGDHAGICVLRVDAQDAGAVTEAVRSFLSRPELGDLTGCIVVVRGNLARVRRPE